MAFENTLVGVTQGGETFFVSSGGQISIASGGKITAAGTQASAIADLTMTVGTGDNTLADVGGAFNQTTLNNNFRDLGEKMNLVLAALRGVGIIAT